MAGDHRTADHPGDPRIDRVALAHQLSDQFQLLIPHIGAPALAPVCQASRSLPKTTTRAGCGRPNLIGMTAFDWNTFPVPADAGLETVPDMIRRAFGVL
ncbi:hypothetical protein JCM9533A_78080 [Catenuloplanes niger JCM 9533]